MYYLIRILVILMMAWPTSLFFTGDIDVGVFCMLAGLALILVELSDIKDVIESN